MERYTFMSDGYYAVGECYDDQSENYCGPAITRLAEYENLEEAGKLLLLPCKIGDTVYQPDRKYTCSVYGYAPKYSHDSCCEGCNCDCDNSREPYVYAGKVCEIVLRANGIFIGCRFDEKWDSSHYEIGKNIFLTREEAEAALK